MTDLDNLLVEVRNCRVCEEHLPYAPRPVLQVSRHARLLIIGQAPGIRVQQSGVPWDDASGNRLREWLQVSPYTFYESGLIGVIPMGFCFPGSGSSGDAPPRLECAPLWHSRILSQLPDVKLTLLIGTYAQNYYLQNQQTASLTETVRQYSKSLPAYFPLPHPSPRNRFWMSKNPWFETEVIPLLRLQVAAALGETI
jgi:uracil-DNA glycosylase